MNRRSFIKFVFILITLPNYLRSENFIKNKLVKKNGWWLKVND